MAKRFIDTKMFEDEWFSELSKDGKLFFIYFITTCDHAGIFKLNKKLLEFQTGIKNFETVRQELGNCLVTVKEGLFFMPKFIKFQYPNFPNSAVKQQEGALKILKGFGLINEESNTYLTVSKELDNSYVNVSVNDNVIVKEVKPKQIYFKDSSIFDIVKFKEQFENWNIEKIKYYHDALNTWSNEGNKKIDWVATARTWASRDEKAGKIKFDVKKPTISINNQFSLMR